MSAIYLNLPENFSFKAKITSASMLPTIAPQDEVKITKIPFRQIQAGDIIAFYSRPYKNIICHRVIKTLKKNLLRTKGDNSAKIDKFLVNEGNYIGKVIKINRSLRNFFYKPFFSVLFNKIFHIHSCFVL